MSRRGCAVALAALLTLGTVAFASYLWSLDGTVPREAEGFVVYVSDRSGVDSLWGRHLPNGSPRQLTHNVDSVRDPALSPDAASVAYSEKGAVAIMGVASGAIRQVTLGIDNEDIEPSWRPDGRALVVSSTRRQTGRGSIDILDLEAKDPAALRTPLTSGAGFAPVFAPDGRSVVFVREETLQRVDLADGRTTRLTGGLRTWRSPRFVASGSLVAQWFEAKQFGVEIIAPGTEPRTAWKGVVRYRDIAPSPDGRFYAATYGYDLQFHVAEALGLRRNGEIRLLDRDGRLLARLAGGLRERAHSADWGPQKSTPQSPAP